MRIGIITSHYCYIKTNYGSLLQNFALQTVLKELGTTPFLIREGEKSSTLIIIKRFLYRLKRIIYRILGRKVPFDIQEFNRCHPRSFDDFIKNELNTTRQIIDKNKINHKKLNADCYIVGSDQVWTLPDFSKLLSFAPPHKRIAYAASANWGKQTNSWFNEARKSFPLFSGISVREKEGLSVCRKAGYFNAKVVLDPTLLLERSSYLSLLKDKNSIFSRKTCLGYFLNIDSLDAIPWNEYLNLCNDFGLEPRVIPLQGSEQCIPAKFVFTPDPYEFLQAYRDSNCIVTNSFHAVVFSIIFHKPFIALEQSGDTSIQNSRIHNLLSLVGLESRIYRCNKGSMSEQMDRPIDWDIVMEKLNVEKQKSLSFLQEAINNIR